MEIVQILLVVLTVETLFVATTSTPQPKATERQFVELNTAKLRDFWQIVIIRGLIKAHAKHTLVGLPPIERVVYELCSRNAVTTVALAKCATRVLDARDNARQQARPVSKHTPVLVESIVYRTNSSLVKNKVGIKVRHKNKRKPPKMVRSKRLKRAAEGKPNNVNNTALIKEDKVIGKPALNRTKAIPRSRPALDLPKIITKYLRKLLLGSKVVSHVSNLKLVHEHFRRVEKCNKFFKQMNDHNRRLFDDVELGIDSRPPKLENTGVTAMQEVLEVVNAYAAQTSDEKISVMSPQLFSIFPEKSAPSGAHLFSPSLFSFQKQGYLSLPELLELIASARKYEHMLLDVIMDVSGAGVILESLVKKIKPDMEDVRYVKLPIVEELSRKNTKWMRAQNSFNEEQRADYKRNGYAFLNDEQMDLIYDRQEQLIYGINATELGSMSKEEKLQRLERDIRQLAALDQPHWPAWGSQNREARHRWRREAATENHASSEPSASPENSERAGEGGITFRTLQPVVFTSLIGTGAAMESVVLSPQVFIAEILFPRALVAEILSPRVFLAAILSPNALIARIMSPTSFRIEVLSPRAFHTWVLSPEAFIAEILSPKFFDPRVLAPNTLLLNVLTPSILSPYILSAEVGSLVILSPDILSPRIQSEEKMVVEVLSPHILGGSHFQAEELGITELGTSGHKEHEGHRESEEESWIRVVNE